MTSTNSTGPTPSAPVIAGAQEYLTVAEAASYLHLRRRTLLDWVKRGLLPGIPLGGDERKTWLFCRATLDEHLRAMMTSDRPRSIQ